MDFFSSCRTLEEAKATFRILSKHFHPDKGGDPKLMMELTTQFEQFPNKPKQNFKPINYAQERENHYQRRLYNQEIMILRNTISGMNSTMIELLTEKKVLENKLKKTANWGFVSRFFFFLFGVKYFNSFFYSNFNGRLEDTL